MTSGGYVGLELSRASVTSYLPYQKGVYFPSTADAPKTPAATATPAPAAPAAKDTVLSACLNGTVVPLADVKDEAFASGALGDGIAIEPTDGELVAPADGEISSTFETHHSRPKRL